MKFTFGNFFAVGGRTLSKLVDWFHFGDVLHLSDARRFGCASVPLYIERMRVDLKNSNFRDW
jgi:hypothetical protein